jgi:hypothetical protein
MNIKEKTLTGTLILVDVYLLFLNIWQCIHKEEYIICFIITSGRVIKEIPPVMGMLLSWIL